MFCVFVSLSCVLTQKWCKQLGTLNLYFVLYWKSPEKLQIWMLHIVAELQVVKKSDFYFQLYSLEKLSTLTETLMSLAGRKQT